MLRFKYIEMKNFMSFGNVPQRVDLDCSPLTLILGVNNDVAVADSAEETRNGVGKSTVIQGINFALYGKSIGNKIKMSNLVNKTNKKHCVVELVFEKDGIEYKIVRKRNPSTMEFYINGTNSIEVHDEDQAQGENRDSQHTIDQIIGMSQDLFTQFVTITTNVDTFLSQSAAKQRAIIEEILTITQLSEKAAKLKELIKGSKESIEREKFRVDTIENANKKILDSIKALETQSEQWDVLHASKIVKVKESLETFADFDFEFELNDATAYQAYLAHSKKLTELYAEQSRVSENISAWQANIANQCTQVIEARTQLEAIDINEELENHKAIEAWTQLSAILENTKIKHSAAQRELKTHELASNKHANEKARLWQQIETTSSAKCHTCGGALHEDKHKEIVAQLNERYEREVALYNEHMEKATEITQLLSTPEYELFDLPEKPTTVYATLEEAYKHQSNLTALETEHQRLLAEKCPHNVTRDDILARIEAHGDWLPQREPSKYLDISSVQIAANAKQSSEAELERLENEVNPYTSQITMLYENSLQKVDYSELNRVRKILDHQEFLLKILTNKNSHVRKRIIDQNLSFLNSRLQTYTEKSGSQHQVTFMNDLSVDITHMGEDYDFDNLSRGEKNRVILALALAFRDTFESLNFSINILMIDELLDNGLDQAGTAAAYKMLNDISNQRDKNCFLITHREELQTKCENILLVVKENGFTTVEQNDAA